jgi:hypothetical protein
MMLDAIRKAGEKSPIHYDPESFVLRQEAEAKGVMYLGNVYKEYCAAGDEQKQILLKNFVRTWFSHRREPPTDFEDVKPDLLPGVRARCYFEITRMKMKREEEAKLDWPFRVLADALGAGLVYDLPESMMQIQQHSLDRWQATFDEAFEVACHNLRAISQQELKEVAPGVWRSPWRDNYDPSRMLLTDYLRQHEVLGDPVVMVPNRDTLLLAGSRDAAALARLATLAEEAFDHPRSITGLAFRLKADDQWVPFLPDRDHPHYQQFQLLRIKSLGSEYSEQAEFLKEHNEKTGKDVFVASFSAVQQRETGEVRSYCVWSEGIVSWLPATDDIYFFRPSGEKEGNIAGSASWEQARTVLGDLMKPLGLYPERYEVEAFPSEEQLRSIAPR